MDAIDSTLLGDPENRLVEDVLSEYGELTRRHLRDYLPDPEADSYLFELIGDYPQRGGKMLRPALCIAAARAFGATPEDAVGSAVSIELMHNALLIHDDIEDNSEERRGAPTLHTLHGVPLALNAGDALGLLSMRPLKENIHRLGPDVAMRIFAETERTAWETTEGQALELGWRKDNRVDIDDEQYLTMVLKKTCWLTTIHPLRVGCLIGARGRLPLDPLIRLGFFFGAAFQIQDDLLNLVADERYGKERNGDLLEGKRTLMVIHALRNAAPRDRARLQRFLARERTQRKASEIEWVRSLMDRTQALAHARTTARALAGAALFEFEETFKGRSGRDSEFIRSMVSWVLQRMH
jgi:geranylgeranyl diphosphate synthase type II